MIRLVLRALKRTGRALLHGLVGGLVALIVGAVIYLENRPDLKVWHTVDLDAEFDAASPVASFAIVSNESEKTQAVVAHQRRTNATEITVSELGLAWPRGLYSLAHIALPFPPDDPVYGGPDAAESPGIQLGNLALRGERGVLQIGAGDMLRLRCNPFHSYIERRVVEVVRGLKSASP